LPDDWSVEGEIERLKKAFEEQARQQAEAAAAQAEAGYQPTPGQPGQPKQGNPAGDVPRKQFRNQAANVALNSATGQAATQQIQKLVDAAEMIANHLALARALQGLAGQALQEEVVTARDLTPRDVLAWITQGVQMERLTLDLDTARIKVDTQIDVRSLSDEELEKLADGEGLAA